MAYQTEDELAELRELVDATLQNCQPGNLPNVCAMNATPQGHQVVRDAVLRNCVAAGISPSAALLELEREYSFTTLD